MNGSIKQKGDRCRKQRTSEEMMPSPSEFRNWRINNPEIKYKQLPNTGAHSCEITNCSQK